jgi:hypothetical protein
MSKLGVTILRRGKYAYTEAICRDTGEVTHICDYAGRPGTRIAGYESIRKFLCTG